MNNILGIAVDRGVNLVVSVAMLVLATAQSEAQGRRLSSSLVSGGDVLQFAMTPDGERVVYLADGSIAGVFELYSVTTVGFGTPVKLHSSLPNGRKVFSFVMDPLGANVVFCADKDTNDKLELFSVPADGSSAPVKLSGPFSSNGDIQHIALFQTPLYAITPDGERVVFVADPNGVTQEIFSAPIDGSAAPVKLSPSVVGDKNVSILCPFQISADGTRVVYQADHDTDGVFEIYSVPVDASSSAVKLNAALPGGGQVITGEFRISADSSRVVFLADQDVNDVFELYSAPLDGSASAVKISGALVSGGEVLRGFVISPDGSRVVYRADQSVDGAVQLYSVLVDGSQAPDLIGGAGIVDRTALSFVISLDGNDVVYVADQDSLETYELYAVPIDGSAQAVDLGGAFPAQADVVASVQITPDSDKVVFVADLSVDDRFDLLSVVMDGSSAPVTLQAGMTNGDVRTFELRSSGTQVVYLADLNIDEVFELYQVPVGGGASVSIHSSLSSGREVLSGFQVSDDRVLYVADQRQDDVFELFRAPGPRHHAIAPPIRGMVER